MCFHVSRWLAWAERAPAGRLMQQLAVCPDEWMHLMHHCRCYVNERECSSILNEPLALSLVLCRDSAAYWCLLLPHSSCSDVTTACFLSLRLHYDNRCSYAGALPARGGRVLWRGQHCDPRGGHRWARQVLRRRGRGHGNVSKHSLPSCSDSNSFVVTVKGRVKLSKHSTYMHGPASRTP